MTTPYFHLRGSFSRLQYFAAMVMACLLWGLMVLVFKGPAAEQFSRSSVIPRAIVITPPLIFFLFASIKRFRHVGAPWWIRVLFLANAVMLAISDLVWLDFSTRFAFYDRVLVSLWLTGTILLVVWPGPGDHTPGFSDP